MNTDYNSVNSNSFTFSINRIPATIFRVVQINLPSISITPPGVPNSMLSLQYYPGSATEFTELQLTFVVDENLDNYEEIYNWITQQRFREEYVPKNPEETELVSDGILITLTNASNPNRVFEFKSLFPTELGGLEFDTRNSNPDPLTCQATFRFSYFRLKPKI